MDAVALRRALDDVFDQAIVSHAFTGYMRDYEMIVLTAAVARTSTPAARLRYLFRYCVEVDVRSAVKPQVWKCSLDDRLIDFDTGKDLEGYVWGVKWQNLYPEPPSSTTPHAPKPGPTRSESTSTKSASTATHTT